MRNHLAAAGVVACVPWATGLFRWWGAALTFVGVTAALLAATDSRRWIGPSLAVGGVTLLVGVPLLLRQIVIVRGAFTPWIGCLVGLVAAVVLVVTGYRPALRALARTDTGDVQ